MNNTTLKKSNEIENSTKSTFGTAKLIFKSSTFSSTKLNLRIFKSSLLTISSTGGGACQDISTVGRKQLSSVVIPQNKANRLRNVSSEPVYAAPSARRRATFNSSLLTVFAVLLCLLFSGTAWGQTLYSGFTATGGTAGQSGQNYDKLVDGTNNQAGNKWCIVQPNDTWSNTAYIEFESATAFTPTKYIFTTGGDNTTYHGRNPKSWKIYGKLNSGDSWTTLVDVTNNTTMQDVDLQTYEFDLTNTTTPCKYFRFEVSAIRNGGVFQLSELQFKGTPYSSSGGEEELTVYSGTATNEYIPMYGFYFDDYTKSECIIPAAQLTDMVGGTISAITFYPSSVNTRNWSNSEQTVFLKEVSGTTLGGSYSGTSGATIVKTGSPLTMPIANQAYTITFTTPYTYNGGNLLIGVYNDDGDNYNRVYWYGTSNLTSGVSAYGSNGSDLNSVGYSAQAFLPKTTFTYTLPVANFPLKIVASNPASDEMTWAQFVDNINNGLTYEGYTVKLMEDISVTTMVGAYTDDNNYKPFSGIFDGQGNTITITLSNQTRFVAPFKCVKDATIRNLRTAGSISGVSGGGTNGKLIAGVVGLCFGNTKVIGCSSSIAISSNHGDDSAFAGIVAAHKGSGTLQIEGCVFTGSMSGSYNGTINNRNAGIMGYQYDYAGPCTITNSFFAPSSLNVDTGNADYSGTIARLNTASNPGADPTITNCYYTTNLGTLQGTKAHTITDVNPVTVAMGGSATVTYEAIGLSFYSGGLIYNDIIYGGNGNNLSLSLSYGGSGDLARYSASNGGTLTGTALTGTNDAYTLAMPDANVEISAQICEAITSFPWTETFESYASGNFTAPCWVNEHISGSSTNIFNITTSGNGNSTHQIYLPDMYDGTLTKLMLPEFNFGGVAHQFVLDVYRNSSTSNYGEGIRVFASSDGNIEGATELGFISRSYTTSDDAHGIPAESGSGWYTYELDIPITGTCYIILRGESKYGSATYMDNFKVRVTPSCLTSISTFAEWQDFCSNVNSGTCSYAGKTVTLENDISITTTDIADLVGTSDYPFKGTFDGQGNTLTVDITINGNDDNYQCAAPFRYIQGATIRNLEVTGDVTANRHHAAGLVGKIISGTNTIYNCHVSTNVTNNNRADNNPHNNNNYMGGLIGHNMSSTTIIEGCVYDGTLTSQGFKGGMIGFAGAKTSTSSITITNSYFGGDYSTPITGYTNTNFSPVGCQSSNAGQRFTISNFYYNKDAVDFYASNNGYQATSSATYTTDGRPKHAYTITGATGVTVAMNGSPTTYSESGITAYSVGIVYDDDIIAGDGDNIDLYLSYGGTFAEYYADYGTLSGSAITGTNDEYTLAMTANNTVINVSDCATPSNLNVANLMPTTATLEWTGSSDSYIVRYREPEVEPFTETFDVNSVPTGWTRYSGLVDNVIAGTATLSTTTSGWNTNTYALGSYNMKVNIYGTSCYYWLVSPEQTLVPGSVLNFDMALTAYNSSSAASGTRVDDRFVVLIYANDSWTILREWNNGSSSYIYNSISTTGENVDIDLSAYNGQTVKIAFYGESTTGSNGDNDLHIDNVQIGAFIAATSWETVEVNTTTATITGLTPETDYEWQVQGVCDGSTSFWSAMSNFTTLDPCLTPNTLETSNIAATSVALNWIGAQQSYDVKYREVIVAPVEYTYDFEDGTTQGWTTIDADGHGDAWSVDSYYGNSGPYCMKATYNSSYDHQDYLVSPEIPLGGTLSFFARMAGSYFDNFRVYLSTTGNTNPSDFTIELTEGDVTPSDSYGEYTYDLSAYSGTGYVAIVYTAIANQYWLGIDDITIVKPGEYGSWITLNGVTSPYTITGLSPETDYEWQVQGINCDGVGGATDWSDLATFTMPPVHTVYANANPTDAGSITGEDFSNGSGIYAEGATCTLTATAADCYTFENWTENDVEVSSDAAYSFTVTGDRTLVANFTLNSYTVTVNAGEGGSASGSGTYNCGENATLTATPSSGYYFYQWNDGNTDNPRTINITSNVTYTATFKQAPLTINNTTDWNNFAEAVSRGYNYSSKTVTLTNDITVNTIIPGSPWATSSGFHGTFDGQCHTITINNCTTSDEFVGLFRYTYGATIKDLIVDGTINSSNIHAGGLIGLAQATTTFTNCRSNVTINSTHSGSAENGGLVGAAVNKITFEGCAFSGSLNGANATQNGGFVGKYYWENNYSHTYTNCLFVPLSMNIGITNSSTFAPTTYNTFTNCYYTDALGTLQGAQVYSVTGGTGVDVSLQGSATQTYSCSDLAFYASGLTFNGTIYGSNLALSLSYEGLISGYTTSNGDLSGSSHTGVNDEYTLASLSGNAIINQTPCLFDNPPAGLIWKGGTDGDVTNWEIATNWAFYNESETRYQLAGSAPSESSNVFIIRNDACNIEGVPSLSSNKECNDITLAGIGVNIADGKYLTVNGTATFTSGIVTGNVTFGSGATVSGASTSSYVNGKVTRNGMSGEFTFPTGTATLYAPFKATSSSASNVSVQYAAGHDGMPDWWNHSGNLYDAGLNHASDRENWQLSASASTELSSIILYWNESDNHSFEEGNEALNSYLNVAAVKRNGFNWQNLGRASIEGDYDGSGSITAAEPLVIEISGAKAAGEGDYFVTFASSNNNLVLPIELTSFTATCDGRSALVEWTTASEKNNDYFVLERSDDAINFTELARVAGAGNSIDPIDYAYTDYGIHGGDNYYRLVQVDYDGTRAVSEVVVVNCIETAAGEPDVQAYPNPFYGELTLELENFDNRPARIDVYDMLGKLIYTDKVASPQNYYETVLNLSNLPPATYTVRVSTADFVINKKVVKQ